MWAMSLWMRIITARKAKARRGMETHEWWGFQLSGNMYYDYHKAELIRPVQRFNSVLKRL